jgi:two-component system response regulator YesN
MILSDIANEKKEIKSIIKNFFNATGIDCTFFNENGESLLSSSEHMNKCSICKYLPNITKTDYNCRDVHFYGLLQSERFGGRYIYFCPVGLTWFVSPIANNEKIIGALLGGPLLMFEKQEFIDFDILQKHKPEKAEYDEIIKCLNTIPEISPERVNSLSEILLYSSSYYLFNEKNKLKEKSEASQQQSEISEYLKAIKLVEDESSPVYPLTKENELLSAITDGDKQDASRLLNEILGYIFFSSSGSFEVIRARVLELVILLSRAALAGGAESEKIFGMNYRYISEINKFKNVDELCFWLTEIMNKFMNNMFRFNEVKHVDVIYKAADYIRRNYMKKISLDDVAEHVYLSPSYFSKIFKNEMNCNFSVYLNNVRIEHSKKLLISDKVKLVDVAGLVGFEDQSYFSKVFKKLTGGTPKKFRETRGKLPSKVFLDETLQ